MTEISDGEMTCLLIVRLNNYRQLHAAFGPDAVECVMDQLLERMGPHFTRLQVRRVSHDEIEIVVCEKFAGTLSPELVVDEFCTILSSEPVLFGDTAMILSLSAGCAAVDDGMGGEGACNRAHDAARCQLMESAIRPSHSAERGEAWAKLYRADMALAAPLLDLVSRGGSFFSWRSVHHASAADILHHEARLCRLDKSGQWVDCDQAYQALVRIGMAHLVDQQVVSRVLDDLELDRSAQLSIPISAQSLSFHLFGHRAGWTELRARLSADRMLANRLILEVDETSPLISLQDAKEFISALRALGARIAIAKFGSGFASIGQLLTLTPDYVKLDSAFLRTALQSDRHRSRLGHLLGLARTVGRMVIVDGVDSSLFFDLAVEEGAEWVVGSHLGNFSLRRGSYTVPEDERIVSLRHFKAGAEQAAKAEQTSSRVALGGL